MASLHHQVWIDAPIGKVYDALVSAAGLSRWWAPHTETMTSLGLVFVHDPGDQRGQVRMLVRNTTRPSRVEWEIVSVHPQQSPASAWTGTRVVFELNVRENPGRWLGFVGGSAMLTVVDFHHFGWDEGSRFLGFSNFTWAEVLSRLREWCERR
jgi:uncharacterized protein YndB with AHSA1/START domain